MRLFKHYGLPWLYRNKILPGKAKALALSSQLLPPMAGAFPAIVFAV